MALQSTFAFGGTSGVAVSCGVAVYVQPSIDGGGTWCDAASFGTYLLTGASGITVLASTTSILAPYPPTDGPLGLNSAVDGIVGTLWRCKWSSTGTYAGGTKIVVEGYSPGGLTT
jgi:hypothetical protein